jgi:Holliday junction resolvasome RuvABC endonuclease subunit
VIVGLDTASDRWHAVVVDGEGQWTSAPFAYAKGRTAEHRRAQLYTTAAGFFRHLPAGSQVFAEEPLALSNGKTTRVLALAAGAIWTAHLEGSGIGWAWVDVAHWKLQVIGKGNATKDEIREWALEHGAGSDWVEDSYDAFAIAQGGVHGLYTKLTTAR